MKELQTYAPTSSHDDEEIKVRRAFQDMTRRKAAGEDRITVDLIKDGGAIMLEKLVTYAMLHDFRCTRELKECQHYTNP